MHYLKWIVIGAVAGVVMLFAVWLVRDIGTRAAVVAGVGAGLAGFGRWFLSLLKVNVDVADTPRGKLIRVIDLPGSVLKYLVVGVYLAGACLYLGHVRFE